MMWNQVILILSNSHGPVVFCINTTASVAPFAAQAVIVSSCRQGRSTILQHGFEGPTFANCTLRQDESLWSARSCRVALKKPALRRVGSNVALPFDKED